MNVKSILAMVALLSPLMVHAQDFPKDLEPIPDVPPPPMGKVEAEAPEPVITIVKKGESTVEEYRINGELYMQKITPPTGKPYYLMKEDQQGGWQRMDGPTPPLVVPKWVLFRF